MTFSGWIIWNTGVINYCENNSDYSDLIFSLEKRS